MKEPIEIDFSAEKTELEFQKLTDKFFLAAAPKIYEWFRWVITLAALSYVQKKTNSKVILDIIHITYTFTAFYFVSYFYQFRFVGFPILKNQKVVFFLSSILSGLLTYFTIYMVTEAVKIVSISKI